MAYRFNTGETLLKWAKILRVRESISSFTFLYDVGRKWVFLVQKIVFGGLLNKINGLTIPFLIISFRFWLFQAIAN